MPSGVQRLRPAAPLHDSMSHCMARCARGIPISSTEPTPARKHTVKSATKVPSPSSMPGMQDGNCAWSHVKQHSQMPFTPTRSVMLALKYSCSCHSTADVKDLVTNQIMAPATRDQV